jgi:hypothetical protein
MTDHWLRVADDHRHLVLADGTPFFYLADTAWELLHRLSKPDTEHYLTARASQGFNAIQTVILAERNGLRRPTPEGHVPFHDLDPARPNEAYFAHVDHVVRRMNELGLVAALLPTWGDKVINSPGEGPQVLSPDNARAYGRFIGDRYKSARVIWVLGGDRNCDKPGMLDTFRQLAHGLKEGDGGRHLMTFHPPGQQSSSKQVHDEPWLDFNMWQTGHSKPELDTTPLILSDLDRTPPKPTFDGEPCYENLPVMGGGWNPTGNARFSAADCRRRAYRALLAGACGHTYGCNEIWMMHQHGDEQFVCSNRTWRQALHLPGANQMRHLLTLLQHLAHRPLQSLPAWKHLVVDFDCNVYTDSNLQSRVRWTNPYPSPAEITLPTAATTSQHVLVYLPMGNAVRLDLSLLGISAKLTWFDPRHGTLSCGGTWTSKDTWFDPPTSGEDWVLIAERA